MSNERVCLLLPRLIRSRDALYYVGMDRNRFNKEVRPHLTEIPIGKQGIAFDQLDLDAWVEQYIAVHGRPSTVIEDESWAVKARQVSASATRPDTFRGFHLNHAPWVRPMDLPDWRALEVCPRIKQAEVTLATLITATQGQFDLFEDWPA